MSKSLFPAGGGDNLIASILSGGLDNAVESGIQAGKEIPTSATNLANGITSAVEGFTKQTNANQAIEHNDLVNKKMAREEAQAATIDPQELATAQLELEKKRTDYSRAIKLNNQKNEFDGIMQSKDPAKIKDALTSGQFTDVITETPAKESAIYRQATAMGVFTPKELDGLLYKQTDSIAANWLERNKLTQQNLYTKAQQDFQINPVSSELATLGYNYPKAVKNLEALPALDYDDKGNKIDQSKINPNAIGPVADQLKDQFRFRDKISGQLLPGTFNKEGVIALRQVQAHAYVDPDLQDTPSAAGIKSAKPPATNPPQPNATNEQDKPFQAAFDAAAGKGTNQNIVDQRRREIMDRAGQDPDLYARLQAKGLLKKPSFYSDKEKQTFTGNNPAEATPPQDNFLKSFDKASKTPTSSADQHVLDTLAPGIKKVIDRKVFDRVSTNKSFQGLSPLAKAVVAIESGGVEGLKNKKTTAEGSFQLTSGAAKDTGVDKSNPQDNIKGGVQYLNTMLSRYQGNETAALMAYNIGMGVIDSAIAYTGGSDYDSLTYGLDYMREQGLYKKSLTADNVKIAKQYPLKVLAYKEAFSRA